MITATIWDAHDQREYEAQMKAEAAPSRVVPIPAAWRASTLRLIADHFYPEAPDKQIIISPSRQQREEWAELLRQEADRLETP